MSGALRELFRHKTWATLRLVEHCQGLPDEILYATIPGTYGSIRDTLRHLVDSDEGYFSQLTGVRASEQLAEGPIAMEELVDRIRRLGPGWEALAEDLDLPAREITAPDGWHFPGAILIAQAIHHADDHRTHVLSILGARSLDVPRVDVWGYARSQGQLQEPRAPRPSG